MLILCLIVAADWPFLRRSQDPPHDSDTEYYKCSIHACITSVWTGYFISYKDGFTLFKSSRYHKNDWKKSTKYLFQQGDHHV